MLERAKSNLEFTGKKLEHAKKFFEEGESAEAIHYIWIIFENCINIIKDIKNNKPVYEHKSKIDIFSIYHSLGFLKQDYSDIFAVLTKLRIRADFGEYSQAPRIPDRKEVGKFLEKAASLFNETEDILRSAGK